MKIHIDSQFLYDRLAYIEEHHAKLVADGHHPPHHGIVPDLIREILSLRGERVPELSYPHFPDFIVSDQ